MVKIPNLDELKKMGGELLDKKHLGGVVDKIKSGVGVATPPSAGAPTKEVYPKQATLQRLNHLLLELGKDHAEQGRKLKQFRQDLNALTTLLSDAKETPAVDESEDSG